MILVLTPVLMGVIGSTFGDVIQAQEDITGVYDVIPYLSCDNEQDTGFFSGLIPNLGCIINNVLTGYAIFPLWFNIILTLIPIAILARAIFSVSG